MSRMLRSSRDVLLALSCVALMAGCSSDSSDTTGSETSESGGETDSTPDTGDSADPDATTGSGDQTEADAAVGAPDTAVDEPDTPGPAATAWLVINEVCPSPVDGEDWLELLAVGVGTVDLADYALVDDNDSHAAETLAAGSVAVGEYVVVYAADEAPADGSAWVPFKLSKDDAVTLTRVASGEVVDVVDWEDGDAPEGSSWGRLPDGDASLAKLNPTPGATNVAFDGTEPLDHPYVTDRVLKVVLELPAESWTAIQADPLAEEYYQGAIEIEGERWEDVGIRTKGNSSLKQTASTGSIRYPFKVDSNLYVDGQTIMGFKKLSFANGFRDPSHLREHVTLGVMRDFGLITPRTGFVDLWMNDTHLGFYTLTEVVDGEFLEDYFDDDSGDLYKPEGPSGSLAYAGDSIESYSQAGLETNEDTSDQTAFLTFIAELDHGDLEAVLDVESALRYLAVSTLLVNLDSYLGPGHNYYLYEQAGVFTVIPWDTNLSFGSFTCSCEDAGLLGTLIDEPTCGALEDKPLVARLLDDPDRLATYEGYLEELMGGLVTVEAIAARVKAGADVIRSTVEADPTMTYTVADFETNLSDDVVSGQKTLFGLTSFVQRRIESVSGQLAGTEPRSNDGEGTCDSTGLGGGGGEDDTCDADGDCAGKCAAAALSCICHTTGGGKKICAATCSDDEDCDLGGNDMICHPTKDVCVPAPPP